MAFGFPAFLELSGRRVVVIGSDAIREGKVDGLLAAGADDVLVLPGPGPLDAPSLPGTDPRVRTELREWRPQDLDVAFLCIATSRDPEERSRIARAARERRVLVNVMDDIPNCDFAAPAIVRRGDLAIAISTGGRSPALARRMRECLGDRFGPEWAEILEIVRRVREETFPLLPDFADRAERWHRALDLEEAEGLVREGRADELRERLHERLVGKGAA